ncbi:MAG: sugar nucleotide-binding protein [Phycisphaerae bacterium]|nr:sugar nucleotide-binding protein [Phycisphaerae bacterium]
MNNTQQKILVTGITSIHGWPIYNILRSKCQPGRLVGICPPKTKLPPDKNIIPMCITDKDQLRAIADEFQPDSVIHCAGVCDLDICEERPGWAYDLNVNGAKAVAEIFGQSCKIYYMSTDLVFSGQQPPVDGYAEIHDPDPVSIAGKTFVQAELVLKALKDSCIVRLGLPLGDSCTGDKGAIDWVKSRLTKDRPVTLFFDEFRSCPWCDQIAQMILAALSLDLKGLYHFGGNESWSLYDIGVYVRDKHNVASHLLKGIYRHEEIGGPPRIGDVSMNCDKLKAILNDAAITIADFN